MRSLSFVIFISLSAFTFRALAQESVDTDIKKNSIHLKFNDQLSCTELFQFKPMKMEKNEISFQFLKDYSYTFYDVSDWYLNDYNGLIPFNITYYNPVDRFHFENEKYSVIKKK